MAEERKRIAYLAEADAVEVEAQRALRALVAPHDAHAVAALQRVQRVVALKVRGMVLACPRGAPSAFSPQPSAFTPARKGQQGADAWKGSTVGAGYAGLD